MKIVVLDGYTENPGDLDWGGFKKLGETIIYDRTSQEDIIDRIGNADIVITNKTQINKKVLQKCPCIRYIGVLATGYNIIDVQAALEKRIIVTNIPSYGSASVGQFAIALLLEICHHVGYHNKAVHNGKWTSNPDWCFWDYPLIELSEKTIGIIGFGRIGQITGRIAHALGMDILTYDKHEIANTYAAYVSLDELYKKSDVIVLHCPLSDETEKIINKESIRKMKDGVIIINNSRGGLIDENDLADALNSGKVYAAGLDVVSDEPILANNPLLKATNCIITPHISWAPKESRKRLMDIAVKNLESFIDGDPINVVNK